MIFIADRNINNSINNARKRKINKNTDLLILLFGLLVIIILIWKSDIEKAYEKYNVPSAANFNNTYVKENLYVKENYEGNREKEHPKNISEEVYNPEDSHFDGGIAEIPKVNDIEYENNIVNNPEKMYNLDIMYLYYPRNIANIIIQLIYNRNGLDAVSIAYNNPDILFKLCPILHKEVLHNKKYCKKIFDDFYEIVGQNKDYIKNINIESVNMSKDYFLIEVFFNSKIWFELINKSMEDPSLKSHLNKILLLFFVNLDDNIKIKIAREFKNTVMNKCNINIEGQEVSVYYDGLKILHNRYKENLNSEFFIEDKEIFEDYFLKLPNNHINFFNNKPKKWEEIYTKLTGTHSDLTNLPVSLCQSVNNSDLMKVSYLNEFLYDLPIYHLENPIVITNESKPNDIIIIRVEEEKSNNKKEEHTTKNRNKTPEVTREVIYGENFYEVAACIKMKDKNKFEKFLTEMHLNKKFLPLTLQSPDVYRIYKKGLIIRLRPLYSKNNPQKKIIDYLITSVENIINLTEFKYLLKENSLLTSFDSDNSDIGLVSFLLLLQFGVRNQIDDHDFDSSFKILKFLYNLTPGECSLTEIYKEYSNQQTRMKIKDLINIKKGNKEGIRPLDINFLMFAIYFIITELRNPKYDNIEFHTTTMLNIFYTQVIKPYFLGTNPFIQFKGILSKGGLYIHEGD